MNNTEHNYAPQGGRDIFKECGPHNRKRIPGLKPIVGGREPGRNTPCPCGSGKKFKRCHGRPPTEEQRRRFAKLKELFQIGY